MGKRAQADLAGGCRERFGVKQQDIVLGTAGASEQIVCSRFSASRARER